MLICDYQVEIRIGDNCITGDIMTESGLVKPLKILLLIGHQYSKQEIVMVRIHVKCTHLELKLSKAELGLVLTNFKGPTTSGLVVRCGSYGRFAPGSPTIYVRTHPEQDVATCFHLDCNEQRRTNNLMKSCVKQCTYNQIQSRF